MICCKVSCVEVLKLRVILCLFIYLFLSWKEHKIKSKWNENDIKIEINQIEIHFYFCHLKSTKWKVCILFPIISIWLKFSFLIHCQRTFMGCNIIVSNYDLIAFELEFEYLLSFVLNQLFLKMQIKKIQLKMVNINFTFLI